MPFHFKYFTVEDDRSTMRIGTDAMILGAWTDVAGISRILEIGTGCGVIALMLAQRSTAMITAIDIHTPSVKQAEENFRNSPWGERLQARETALTEMSVSSPERYDLIVTNPPFFSDSLPSPSASRSMARHDSSLPHHVILSASRNLLNDHGRLVLILPEREGNLFLRKSAMSGFHLKRHLSVFSREQDPRPVRLILDLSLQPAPPVMKESLVIRKRNNQFTTDYLTLTEEYHIFRNSLQMPENEEL